MDKDQTSIEKKTLNFKSLHFGWFVGHSLTVISTTIFILSSLLFHPSGFFYRLAYLGIVASYGIVLYNSYKPFNTQNLYIKRMLMDENAQYLVIAVYFLFTRRIAVTLLPFYIYSIVHTLEFADSELIPSLAPHQTKIQEQIRTLIDQYHDKSMDIVSKIEVCGVMTRLVLGLFVFKSSVFSILLYTNFLRLRYYMSTHTRQFLNELGGKIDHLLTTHPKVPPAVLKAYNTFKSTLDTNGTQPTAPAAAAATKKQS